MPKNLKDFQEDDSVFIDANIFLHHAFGTNAVSTGFLKKVETEQRKAYTSALVLEEVAFKLVMQSASNFVEKINLDKLKSLLGDKKNRKKVLDPVEKYMGYIDILRDMGLRVIDLTGKDITLSVEKAKAHGLITADAAHLAVMERKGIKHIASSDGDFGAVEHITLWSPV